MNEIKAFIEIPAWSTHKYELDKSTGLLFLDRVLNQQVPANYGFIQDTLAEDGDPLDVFIVASPSLIPGSVCKLRVQGIFICTDNGVSDHKILASLSDGPVITKDIFLSIIKYLRTYKPEFKYLSHADEAHANEEIRLCRREYELKSIGTIIKYR